MFLLRRVHGESMSPTIKHGEIILAKRNVNQLRVGQVVIANVDNRQVIKRISKIKHGELFLEGDNKEGSTDSREYGFVSRSNIYAKVIAVLSKRYISLLLDVRSSLFS